MLNDEEEKKKLLQQNKIEMSETGTSSSRDTSKKMTIFEAAVFAWNNDNLRNIFTLYIMSNAVFKSMNMLCTIFLEAKLSEEGLGVDPKELTMIAFISYFPSLLILLVSPMYVPSVLGFKKYMTIIGGLYSLGIILTPFWKDLISVDNIHILKIFIFTNQVMIYTMNPKMFSPFINVIVGQTIDRNGRTALNSFSFII